MSGQPAFRLTRNGRPVAEVDLGPGERAVDEANTAIIEDVQLCGFEVAGRESDQEYRVRVGDRDSGAAGKRGPVGIGGSGRGESAVWDDARYFDGARGTVEVRLESRSALREAPWEERVRLPVHVRSHKLSEDRYRTMTEQLRRLATGLLFDLVSPMLRSLTMGEGRGGVSSRSGQEELRLLETLWAVIARALLEVERDPVTRLTRVVEPRLSWGGERLGARALGRLAAAGIDPRRAGTPRPLTVLHDRLDEVTDTPEHRAIAGMLHFLQGRVDGCARDILGHRKAILADRGFRDRLAGADASLFETEDRPRMAKLGNALDRAERLARAIREARAMPLFRGLVPTLRFDSTPVFEHIRHYRAIRDQFLRYLRSSCMILEAGTQERMKSTHRLYEQWVFFQLAAALRAAGLHCTSQEGLFQRAHRFRYTLDVDRGARLTFLAPDRRAVVLRYEPWVLPLDLARHRRESLYRGRSGEQPWSPDVLIEFLDATESGRAHGTVSYAVVVDAKYTTRLTDHHWAGVLKYQDIRATHNRRQAVKQVWLAYLAQGESTAFEDGDLTWPDDLALLGPDESARGRLVLIPPARLPDSEEDDDSPGWIPAPERNAREFIEHLLRFRGIAGQAAEAGPTD